MRTKKFSLKGKRFKLIREFNPSLVCGECGVKYGTVDVGLMSTFHINTCDVCGDKDTNVTEARDYNIITLKEVEEIINDPRE